MTGAGRPRSAEAFRDRSPGADLELAYAGIETFLEADHRDVGELADEDVGVLSTPFDTGRLVVPSDTAG
jgi:agmatinase